MDVRLLSTSSSNKMPRKAGNGGDLYSCRPADRKSAAAHMRAARATTSALASVATPCDEHCDGGAAIAAHAARCSEEREAASGAAELAAIRTAVKQSHFSRDRLFNGNVSSTAHVFFDLLKLKRNSESTNESGDKSSGPELCHRIGRSAINAEVDNMRLNIPAADSDGVDVPIAPKVTASSSASGRVSESGTLIGAIVSHPSLTIHVNQSANAEAMSRSVVNHSAGVSIVSCYRAVPVQVLNGDGDRIISMSNTVHIVNDNGASGVKAPKRAERSEKSDSMFTSEIRNDDLVNALDNTINSTNESGSADADNATSTMIQPPQRRTFASTEAQTDDLQQMDAALIDGGQRVSPVVVAPATICSHPKSGEQRRGGGGSGQADGDPLTSREQRRRERRERRQARNARQQHMHLAAQTSGSLQSHHSNCEILPDILHSHVPPPYTTLPLPPHCQISAASPPPSVLLPGPPSTLITPIPVGIADDGRYTFPLPIMRR